MEKDIAAVEQERWERLKAFIRTKEARLTAALNGSILLGYDGQSHVYIIGTPYTFHLGYLTTPASRRLIQAGVNAVYPAPCKALAIVLVPELESRIAQEAAKRAH